MFLGNVNWYGNHAQVLKIEKCKQNICKIREKIVLQSGWNGLIALYSFKSRA